MKKLAITLHIEMPDLEAVDSNAHALRSWLTLNDYSIEQFMLKIRKEVEYTCYSNDSVDLVINGTAPDKTEVSVQTVVQKVQTGVLSFGTRVLVTFQDEQTSAEVIGYDQKYRLHKVRTSCGKVLLRKIHTA